MDPDILSIILYGSRARHDNDELSDIDLCIFTKERGLKDINKNGLKKLVSKYRQEKINFTVYPSTVVDLMVRNGSLFMWHLKIEGEVLYGKNHFLSKVKNLNNFKNHLNEIKYHSEIFYDLIGAWKSLRIINELDLSTLFTITRNTLMILSHYAGRPVFGRSSCFIATKELFPSLPIEIDEYKYLASWKIIYERGIKTEIELPELDKYEMFLYIIRKVLIYATNKIAK